MLINRLSLVDRRAVDRQDEKRHKLKFTPDISHTLSVLIVILKQESKA